MSLLVGARRALLTPTSFSVLSLVGLQLWLDAGAISGLNDGDAVTTWADLSPLGNSPTQATSGKRPLYKTGIVNGRPVVRFDGTDDYLATAAFGAALAQPNTLLAVVKVNGGQGAARSLMDGNGSNRNSLTAGSSNVWSAFAGSVLNTAAATELTSFHVVEVLFNAASGAIAADGAQQVGSTGANAQGAFVIGIDRLFSSNPAPIDVAELIFCSGTLIDRPRVRRYLGAKYGLAVA